MTPVTKNVNIAEQNGDEQLERYPGIRPFGKNQSLLFYGRTTELNELLNSIKAYSLFVLHSKSGLGKTSLLNAGLIPLLQKEGYMPIEIRFRVTNIAKDNSFQATDPFDAIEDSFKPFINVTAASTIKREYKTLWVYLKLLTAPQAQPVLIFDQFEEFFSHPDKTRKDQITLQIAELLNDKPPAYMYDFINDHKDIVGEDDTFFLTPPQLHILFSIRSDKLSLLDEMKTLIPSITNKRFQLNPLYAAQARQAIMLPASLINFGDFSFKKPAFEYETKALETILKVLQDKPNATEIESTQLQIICESIEKKILIPKKGEFKEIIVTEKTFDGEEGLRAILKNFYNNQLAALAGKPDITTYDMDRVRDMIETRMILDEMRVGLLEKQVINSLKDVETLEDDEERIKKAQSIIKELVDLRIIRSEDTYLGPTYVITHDTLLRPIQESHKQNIDQKEKNAAQSFQFILNSIDTYSSIDPFLIIEFFATKMVAANAPKPLTEPEMLKELSFLDHPRAKRLIVYSTTKNFLKPGKTGSQIQYQIANQFMVDLLLREHQSRKAIRDFEKVAKEKEYLEHLEKKNKTRGLIIGGILVALFIGALIVMGYFVRQTAANERILASNLNYEAERSYNEGNTVLAYALWRKAHEYAPGDSAVSANLASKKWVPYLGSNILVSDDRKFVATINKNKKLSVWKDGEQYTELLWEKTNVAYFQFFPRQPIISVVDDLGHSVTMNLATGDTVHFKSDQINLDDAVLAKGPSSIRPNNSGNVIMIVADKEAMGLSYNVVTFWTISGRYLENISNTLRDLSSGNNRYYQRELVDAAYIMLSEEECCLLSFKDDKAYKIARPDKKIYFDDVQQLNDSLYVIITRNYKTSQRSFIVFDMTKEKIVYRSAFYHDDLSIISDHEVADKANNVFRVYNFISNSFVTIRFPNEEDVNLYYKLGKNNLLIGRHASGTWNLATVPIADTSIFKLVPVDHDVRGNTALRNNYVFYKSNDSTARLFVYDLSKGTRKMLLTGVKSFEALNDSVIFATHGKYFTDIKFPDQSMAQYSFENYAQDSIALNEVFRFRPIYPKFLSYNGEKDFTLFYLDSTKNKVEHLTERYKPFIDKKLKALGIKKK